MRRCPYAVSFLGIALLAALIGTAELAAQTATRCGVPPVGYNVIESDAPVINGTGGPDYICAGDGNNVISARSGHDIVYAGGGDDKVLGNGGNDTIFGGDGSDQLKGGKGNDTLHGGNGADRLLGGPNRDELRGGDGNDHLDGERHSDKAFGGDGADRVLGGAGSDDIRGGPGNDILIGGGGDDGIAGGAGIDTADGRGGNDRCTATSVLNCVEPLGDAYFTAVDRVYFFRAQDPEDAFNDIPEPGKQDVRRVFSSKSFVTLEFWATSDERVKVRPDVRVRTSGFGGFDHRLDEAVPHGTHVAVVDESTGHRVEQTLDLSIDVTVAEDADGAIDAFLTGEATPDNEVWLQQKPFLRPRYSFFPDNGATARSDSDGGWQGILRDIGAMSAEFLAMSQDSTGSGQMMYAYSASSPTIDAYQVGVDGYGWTPGDVVIIQAEPNRALGPIPVDASGHFTTGPTMNLVPGTRVTALELGTGRTKVLDYQIEVLHYTTNQYGSVIVGRGPEQALGRGFLSFTDGTSSRAVRFSVDGNGRFRSGLGVAQDLDFGVVSIEDEDGDYMSAIFRLIP